MSPKNIMYKPGTKVYKEHKFIHSFEVQEQAKLIYEIESRLPLAGETGYCGQLGKRTKNFLGGWRGSMSCLGSWLW